MMNRFLVFAVILLLLTFGCLDQQITEKAKLEPELPYELSKCSFFF